MHPHNHNPKIKNEAAKVFHGLIASYMNDTAEGSNNLEDLPTQKPIQIANNKSLLCNLRSYNLYLWLLKSQLKNNH